MEIMLNVNELPVWVGVEEARKIVPFSELKKVRENKQVRMTTYRGKQVYLLVDLLAVQGVKDLIYIQEVSVPNYNHQEIDNTDEVHQEPKDVAQDEVDSKDVAVQGFKVEPEAPVASRNIKPYKLKTFIYTRVFAKPYMSRFPEMVTPAFGVTYPKEGQKLAYDIHGKIVDLQIYLSKAHDGNEVYKSQIILEKEESVFYILQIPLYYEETILVEMILDAIIEPSTSLSNPLELHCYEEAGKNAYTVSIGDNRYDWSKPEGYIPKTPTSTIIAKWGRAWDLLVNHGETNRVHRITSDKEFFKLVSLHK